MRRWTPLAGLTAGVLLCTAGVAQNDAAPLVKVADVPLTGPAVRFDYQSLDAKHGRLYMAHMNADQLVVFDTQQRKVIATLDGFKRVHGVIAVPQISRIFASATGDHRVNVVDMESLKTIATPGPIQYPDGLAYAPPSQRLFVSDEHGGVDAVIDVQTNNIVKSIPLGGGAGNTVYDPGTGLILVAVHGVNQIVEIDPMSLKIVGRYFLRGLENPHGIALDSADHIAFIAGEENHALAVFDLKSSKVLSVHQVGDDPDVLAFDPGLKRLYVSAESGTVTVFAWQAGLRKLGEFNMPHAHTVAVDPQTHLVYFPLENLDGKPRLRIMRPAADSASK
jgi:DNA-binding beta-propeller fold protein YncE